MKTFIIAAILTISTLQAEDIVHYDKKEVKPSSMSKPNHLNSDDNEKTKASSMSRPNHPNNDLYPKAG